MCIPASSNVCKIIAFSGIIAGGTFSAAKHVLHFLSFWFILHVFADFETANKPNEAAKKPDETAKKSRAQNDQNVQTETAKKTGNGENLSSRR